MTFCGGGGGGGVEGAADGVAAGVMAATGAELVSFDEEGKLRTRGLLRCGLGTGAGEGFTSSTGG
ncbi:MAG: agmatinase, partial [Acidobacteria bacterium]